MVPKASQRGGGQQLATHLLNSFDNEEIEVAEVRGAIAADLHGAFEEWFAISKATQCRKYLYSLSLNPNPEQGRLPRALYADLVARTERALGLVDQPRAVVFHVKHGREHCHVVWSRINGDTLKAVHLSHDHQQLRTVVRDFAREHGLQLPPGMRQDRGRDRYRHRQKRENLAEQQQQERTGITKEERMEAVTAAWRESRTGPELITALEKRGYLLARGDRRAYVVVDRGGEIHSLAKQVIDGRVKDVKARLADYPLEKLPDARKAQDFIRRQRALQGAAPEAAKDAENAPAARREALGRVHGERRDALAVKKAALEAQHGTERETLALAQKDEKNGVVSARLTAQPQGVLAFLTRITGIRYLVETRQHRQDVRREAEHKRQRDALARRHGREMQDFSRHEKALNSIEKRERRSLETAIRREALHAAAVPAAASPRDRPKDGSVPAIPGAPQPGGLSAAQQRALDQFRVNARDIGGPPTGPPGGADRLTAAGRDASPTVTPPFNDAAEGAGGAAGGRRLRDLVDEFRRRARAKDAEQTRAARPDDPARGRDRGR